MVAPRHHGHAAVHQRPAADAVPHVDLHQVEVVTPQHARPIWHGQVETDGHDVPVAAPHGTGPRVGHRPERLGGRIPVAPHLEDDGLHAALGEPERRHRSAVAGADDDGGPFLVGAGRRVGARPRQLVASGHGGGSAQQEAAAGDAYVGGHGSILSLSMPQGAADPIPGGESDRHPCQVTRYGRGSCHRTGLPDGAPSPTRGSGRGLRPRVDALCALRPILAIRPVLREHGKITWGSRGTRARNGLGPAEAGPRGTSRDVGFRQAGLPMAAPLRALNESSMVSTSLALAFSVRLSS